LGSRSLLIQIVSERKEENTNTINVTFDTNVFPASGLIQKAEESGYRIHVVSVTERESEGCGFTPELKPLVNIPETFVLDESKLDSKTRLKDDNEPHRLEIALRILSNGSFPPIESRQNLTNGQRRMLRDAMILASHARVGHEIFVTKDAKGFVKHGRREEIEAAFQTKVLLVDEFWNLIKAKFR